MNLPIFLLNSELFESENDDEKVHVSKRRGASPPFSNMETSFSTGWWTGCCFLIWRMSKRFQPFHHITKLPHRWNPISKVPELQNHNGNLRNTKMVTRQFCSQQPANLAKYTWFVTSKAFQNDLRSKMTWKDPRTSDDGSDDTRCKEKRCAQCYLKDEYCSSRVQLPLTNIITT